MNQNHSSGQTPPAEGRDPLGLGQLPLAEPPRDGWAEIRAGLEAGLEARLEAGQHEAVDQESSARPHVPGRRMAAGLAVAACLLLLIGITQFGADMAPRKDDVNLVDTQTDGSAAPGTIDAADTVAGTVNADVTNQSLLDLIAMSQDLEQRLRQMRAGSAGMSSREALYVAELEDLVARVDGQLGQEPESLELWTQRVNLMLDLTYIFQHRFEEQYGRMASL
jgi:hypothetical protein